MQGHVDTIASIIAITPDGNAITFRLQPRDKGVLRYIVEKGYVALDGASLTITLVTEDWFEIMLISYTQTRVVMGGKKVGESVNVEVDTVGKYVEKSVDAYFKEKGGGDFPVLEKMVGRILDGRLNKP